MTDGKVDELKSQVDDLKRHFPKFRIALFACGDEYPPSEIDVFDYVDHYSDVPLGLLKPWQLLAEYAANNRFENIIFIDGDNQHIIEEVHKLYREYCDGDQVDLVLPQRKERYVFTSDPVIHGPTFEDVENAFLKQKHEVAINDLQPGLFIIFNVDILGKLCLDNIDPWTGDLAVLDQLLQSDVRIQAPNIVVRPQQYTISNRNYVLKSIRGYERYFTINLAELVKKIKGWPEYYLHGGKIIEIDSIVRVYNHGLSRKKVKKMKGLILSGGLGTRLRPLTHTLQKQLIPIANKPIIFYVIEDLVNAGIKDIGIIYGPNKEQMFNVIGDGSRWDAKITFIEQAHPRGLAHAVLTAKDFLLDSDFVMYLGDNLLKGGIDGFVNDFITGSADASIMLTKVDDPQRFGIVELDDYGRIIKLLEKPKNPPSNLAIVGIYAFKPVIFKAIDKTKPSPVKNELEITDAIQNLLEMGSEITFRLVEGWWKDTGKPEALLEANQLVLDEMTKPVMKARLGENVTISGRVSSASTTVISDNVTIRGPVVIGENCEIKNNVYIGPYTTIGNNVKISNTDIEFSMIFDNTEIEAYTFLCDSLIGSDSVVSSSNKVLHQKKALIVGEDSVITI